MRKKIKVRVKKNNMQYVNLVTISKFQATHLNWQWCWSQFECEIDPAEFAQVTKFNFLKEMLKPKLRVLVHGLPFATEDCVCERERAKNIL